MNSAPSFRPGRGKHLASHGFRFMLLVASGYMSKLLEAVVEDLSSKRSEELEKNKKKCYGSMASLYMLSIIR